MILIVEVLRELYGEDTVLLQELNYQHHFGLLQLESLSIYEIILILIFQHQYEKQILN
jgi:hypothetical protein